MKTTKLKERIIRASRSEKTKKNLKRVITISFMLVFSMALGYGIIMEGYDLSPVWILLGIPIAWIPTSMIILNAILKKIRVTKEEVIHNNKIINVIMSDINVVSCIINTYLYGPLLLIISIVLFPNIEKTLLLVLVLFVIMTVCNIKASKIISEYFEKKLSK